MKKQWSAPRLLIMVRSRVEELTLTSCKIGHGSIELGPDTSDYSCNYWTGVCSPCEALGAS